MDVPERLPLALTNHSLEIDSNRDEVKSERTYTINATDLAVFAPFNEEVKTD